MFIAYKDDTNALLKKPKHPINVREILSHTSGLTFATPVEAPTFDRLMLADAARHSTQRSRSSSSPAQIRLLHAGTNTAGRIIEVVTGQSYEDFMQERLFTPLGMTDTTFWPSEEQLAPLRHHL